MVQRLTTEEEQSLALQDAFADRQYTTGVLTGGALDLVGPMFDFLDKTNQTRLLENVGRDTVKRGKGIQELAGKGDEEALAAASGRKAALARDAIRAGATAAVQDPTGVGAIEFARRAPRIIDQATDVSQETTQRMQDALNKLALGETIISKGEQQKLLARQDRARARRGLVQAGLEGAGKLAQAIKPVDFETRQKEIVERQGLKAERLQDRLDAPGRNLSDEVLEGKITSEQAANIQENIDARKARLGTKIQTAQAKKTEAQKNLDALTSGRIKGIQQLLASQVQLPKQDEVNMNIKDT